MSVGKVGLFDLAKDNWEMYIDRLEQYFVANSVKSELKVATLITVIESEAYELMVSLCTPAKPASMTCTELVALMQGHLNPKPSLLAERFKFRKRVQQNNESIANFVTDLKKLSKDCSFKGDSLKENLRDQFVCGLVNDDIRQKLFTEDDSITFDKAYRLAVAMEAAETNAALVDDCARNRTGDSVPTSAAAAVVHQLRATARSRPAGGSGRAADRSGGPSASSGAGSGKMRGHNKNYNTTSRIECKVCGSKHDGSTSKYKIYVCRICNKEGHLKKMCPKLRGDSTLYNVIEEKVSVLEDSDDNTVFDYFVYVL
ncbi:uncharacterized protein [Choristoneura fumiferana]|uniref:uncharacterized protein n=1 Tax=Choristoneura fumiferana TaxID=7141 RepID=UPI003D15D8F1